MDIEHEFCNGVYIKKCHFKRGERGEQHAHNFDHISVVASGFVRVFTHNTKAREYGPGDCITIPAETVHQVVALTDALWLCIHRTDITDPDLVDADLIQQPD